MKVTDKVSSVGRGDYQFNKLPQNNKIIAEYVWIGGRGLDIRSKSRTLDIPKIKSLSDIPEWNYDGSSTFQASGHDSEILLKPRVFYPDPFRLGNNILVLCDTWKPDGTPTNTNFRSECLKVMNKAAHEEPWFGFEQEYVLYRNDTYPHRPLGFPEGGYPAPQGPYYCSVGGGCAFGRQIMEAHYRCCLYTGISISGTNSEVFPGQWEFQIGPVTGIHLGDQVWMARYLLLRVAEHYGTSVNWECKPVIGEWNGSGCHANFSTNSTRREGGIQTIYNYIEKLREKHMYCIDGYGKDNAKRLSGTCETSNINTFSFGVADRGASIRIPRVTANDGKGYFEDRRPASNSDPYVVSALLTDVTVLDGNSTEELHDRYVSFLTSIRPIII
ncbi:unnamed protein product [Blepharisma stoltei]|uniref:Glutamine synthetase n=1 Tax=Blepharisma stoltei TaxID=1481888 RepID=A0AAU9J5Z5_9CILI|nr:unnamed protein product [Blepharisma stoltei]